MACIQKDIEGLCASASIHRTYGVLHQVTGVHSQHC
jgi:hypothetical protein